MKLIIAILFCVSIAGAQTKNLNLLYEGTSTPPMIAKIDSSGKWYVVDSLWMQPRIDTAEVYVIYADDKGYVRAYAAFRVRSGKGNRMLAGYYDDPNLKTEWFHLDGKRIDTKWILYWWLRKQVNK